jgi:cell wall-associated NlpC family hydrolase
MLRGVHLAIMRHVVFLAAWLAVSPCWADSATPDRDRPLIHALEALGVQYRYGGRSPESGFDCSGLVAHVFERAWGMLLPPGTEALSKVGMSVKRKELQPGDLVFYNTRNRPFSHVGIYLGDGYFLHAPRTGAVVRVESAETGYWRARFSGARRVYPPTF